MAQSEELELGFLAGQTFSVEEASEKGLLRLWGEGGLKMVINPQAEEWRRVSFRVMTEEEHRKYKALEAQSSIHEIFGP